MTEALGPFGHHPEIAIDFTIEVEALENLMNDQAMGHTGFGREADYETIPARLGKALDFRSIDPEIASAKEGLRDACRRHGYSLGECGYFGAPALRLETSHD